MAKSLPYHLVSDSLAVDAHAPWMDVAYKELKTGAKELKTQDSFTKLYYVSLVQDEVLRGMKHSLLKPILREKVEAELNAEQATMASGNAPIAKYLSSVKTDPKYGKGKSSPLRALSHGDPEALAQSGRTAHWQVTAWCAAFVNWCLTQAGCPALGYATADSWLTFGTPMHDPQPGCITVMPPMSSTGGGTGHVGFFVKREGALTYLLGGNQHDEINITAYKRNPVGYRWPTSFNYLLTTSSRLA